MLKTYKFHFHDTLVINAKDVEQAKVEFLKWCGTEPNEVVYIEEIDGETGQER